MLGSIYGCLHILLLGKHYIEEEEMDTEQQYLNQLLDLYRFGVNFFEVFKQNDSRNYHISDIRYR